MVHQYPIMSMPMCAGTLSELPESVRAHRMCCLPDTIVQRSHCRAFNTLVSKLSALINQYWLKL
jgi:hypothetical protein